MSTLAQIFGQIQPPSPVSKFSDVQSGGIGEFIQLLLNILIVVGSLYSLFNFVLAGYGFLSAGDDPKKIAGAWAKIWQTVIGLVIVAGAFVLAALFGWLIFRDFNALLKPTLVGI